MYISVTLPQADIERADALRLCGEQFIEENHYAVDCIRPKCAELERTCNDYNNLVNARRRRLEVIQQLHYIIVKVHFYLLLRAASCGMWLLRKKENLYFIKRPCPDSQADAAVAYIVVAHPSSAHYVQFL